MITKGYGGRLMNRIVGSYGAFKTLVPETSAKGDCCEVAKHLALSLKSGPWSEVSTTDCQD